MWRVYKLRAPCNLTLGTLIDALARLDGRTDYVFVDRAGSEPVRALRIVNVDKRGDTLRISVRFKAPHARIRSEELEVKVRKRGCEVTLLVRRTKGIGRVPEDFVPHALRQSLPLTWLKYVRGGLIVAIESSNHTLRQECVSFVARLLESMSLVYRVIRDCAVAIAECIEGTRLLARAGYAVVCEGYIVTARALYGLDVSLESAPGPDAAIVIYRPEGHSDLRLAVEALRAYSSPLLFRGLSDEEKSEIKSKLQGLIEARGFLLSRSSREAYL